MDYNSLKVKQLKEILNQRNVKCTGCSEKAEFVKKCQETEHLELWFYAASILRVTIFLCGAYVSFLIKRPILYKKLRKMAFLLKKIFRILKSKLLCGRCPNHQVALVKYELKLQERSTLKKYFSLKFSLHFFGCAHLISLHPTPLQCSLPSCPIIFCRQPAKFHWFW